MSLQSIDFLPARFRERRAQRQAQIWSIAVVLMFSGMIALAWIGQTALKMSIQRELIALAPAVADTLAARQALDTLRSQVANIRDEADLVTYLEHPWPRTQILARLAERVPDAVTLHKIHIGPEIPTSGTQFLTPGIIKPVETPGANGSEAAKPPTGTAAARDLARLRDEAELRRTVVELTGSTRSIPALHTYLNRLANERIFAQAELTSIQSIGPAEDGTSQFTARLTLRPGYGQPDGPIGPSLEEVNAQQPALSQRDAAGERR